MDSLYGKYVRNKINNKLGVIKPSSFGYSIHMITNYDDKLVFGKSLGMNYYELTENWDILDELPKGFVIGKFSLPMTEKEKEKWDSQ